MSFWTAMLGGQVRFIDVGGIRTRILEAGDEHSDRTLILLHGTSGHAENWLENVVPLSAVGHVVAPDLLGHGFNSRPVDHRYDFRALLDHVAELSRVVGGGERVDLLGMSLGGLIGGLIAGEFPELVRTNVMLCPPAVHPRGDETLNRTTNQARALFANPSPEAVRDRFVRMLHRPEVINPDFIATRVILQGDPEAPRTVLPILEDFNKNWREYQLNKENLGRIECPSLFVWGRYNHPGPEVAEDALPLLKNGSLIVMEESGHWPHLEDKDRFEREVIAYLREH